MASSGGSCSQFQTQTSSFTEGSSSQAEGAVPHVEWDWCNDRLVWTPYSPVASSIIESVFQSGRPSVELAFRGESYSIVFEKSEIVQRNLASSRVRHVKREAMDGTPVSWLWSSEHGWNSYNSELSQNIEKAWQESNRSKKIGSRNGPAGYSFTIHMQTYLIEFEGDGTQYNTTTNYSRRVRRRLSLGNSNMQDGGETTSNHLRIAWSLTCDESCDSLAQSHYSRHMVDLADPPMTEDCAICLSGLHERPGAVKLSRCKHLYHRDCILTWFKNRPTCPKCSRICGIITGNQPCGEMHVQYLPFQVGKWEIAGYPNTDVIKITYGFPSGIQSSGHPNPGMPYIGTIRTAYLPKNRDGEEVLDLLKIAWRRRLLFCIGTSVTTGINNVVIWAGIHHKTSMKGRSSYHGYPDETYFSRVKKELEEVAVVKEENLQENGENT